MTFLIDHRIEWKCDLYLYHSNASNSLYLFTHPGVYVRSSSPSDTVADWTPRVSVKRWFFPTSPYHQSNQASLSRTQKRQQRLGGYDSPQHLQTQLLTWQHYPPCEPYNKLTVIRRLQPCYEHRHYKTHHQTLNNKQRCGQIRFWWWVLIDHIYFPINHLLTFAPVYVLSWAGISQHHPRTTEGCHFFLWRVLILM